MSKHAGFSLIELLVVISIIVILAAISLISYRAFSQQSRDSKRQSDLRLIQGALEQYRADQGYYPVPAAGSCPATSDGQLRIGCPLQSPSGSKSYLNLVPSDPVTDNLQYCYKALPDSPACDNLASKCISYELSAKLEGTASGSLSCGIGTTYNLSVLPP